MKFEMHRDRERDSSQQQAQLLQQYNLQAQRQPPKPLFHNQQPLMINEPSLQNLSTPDGQGLTNFKQGNSRILSSAKQRHRGGGTGAYQQNASFLKQLDARQHQKPGSNMNVLHAQQQEAVGYEPLGGQTRTNNHGGPSSSQPFIVNNGFAPRTQLAPADQRSVPRQAKQSASPNPSQYKSFRSRVHLNEQQIRKHSHQNIEQYQYQQSSNEAQARSVPGTRQSHGGNPNAKLHPQYFFSMGPDPKSRPNMGLTPGIQGPQTPQKPPLMNPLSQQGYAQQLHQLQMVQQAYLHQQQQLQYQQQHQQQIQQQHSKQNPKKSPGQNQQALFSNKMLQTKSIPDGPPIRSSQKLVEAAEQLFLQKQMYLQMLQRGNASGAGGHNSTHPAPQVINLEQPMAGKRDVSRSSDPKTKSEAAADYSEFQDYLLQQQIQQQDYLNFAHSKKQRDFQRAKELSQNIAQGSQETRDEAPAQRTATSARSDKGAESIMAPSKTDETRQSRHQRDGSGLKGSAALSQSQQHFQPGPQSGKKNLRHNRNQPGVSQLNTDEPAQTHQQPSGEEERAEEEPQRSKSGSIQVDKSVIGPPSGVSGMSGGTAASTQHGGASAINSGSLESDKIQPLIQANASETNENQPEAPANGDEENVLSKVSEESFMEDAGDGEQECDSNMGDDDINDEATEQASCVCTKVGEEEEQAFCNEAGSADEEGPAVILCLEEPGSAAEEEECQQEQKEGDQNEGTKQPNDIIIDNARCINQNNNTQNNKVAATTKKPNDEELPKEKKPSVPRAPWRQKKEEKDKEKAAEVGAAKAAKTKKNNKILASMPANWEEEEKKFFEANYEYNPQFIYDSPATNKRFLKMFPAPLTEYLPQAKQIIDKFLETYGNETNYLNSEGKPIQDRDEVEKLINDYLDELGPEVKAVSKINFSNKNVASTSVTYDNWTNKIRINVRLPVAYRQGRYLGVLHHEIGSHFLRRFNEVQQPWHNERKKWALKSTMTIEEGSGCVNMMLEQSKDPKKFTYLFKPALNYYMCCKASEMSFAELFKDLEKYVDNPKTRYQYILRVKRGLADTSQPGGLYKDQVYLEGALKLLESRRSIDWQGFYSAKLNLEDLSRTKLMKKLRKENIVLPKFVEDPADYVRRLDVIAKHNFVD